jgi:HAD superfamily hydrolase (TIGR01509 family)
LINKFNLNKSETLFFDDKERNVISANNVGIRALLFTSIEDIENNLN